MVGGWWLVRRVWRALCWCCTGRFLTDLDQNASIPLDQPEENKGGLIPGIPAVDTCDSALSPF